MQVFKMNQADYFAAETMEDAIRCCAKLWCGGDLVKLLMDGLVEDPSILSPCEMDNLKHHGDENAPAPDL